jgi:uncharacterized protein (DUF885 family)
MAAALSCVLIVGAPAPEFDQLVDSYFDAYFAYRPTEATTAGIHQYDAKYADTSAAGLAALADRLHDYRKRFEAIDPHGLPPAAAADRELVLSHIRSNLLELEVLRPHERNPSLSPQEANYSILQLRSREFAPPARRLASVIAREKRIPVSLAAARESLRNPPRVLTEIAIERMPGIIQDFEQDVRAAFASVSDEKLQDELCAANQAVITALKEYERFLREDLLPRSGGDFRIGAENLRLRLLYDEMVDIPLDRLLQIGYDDLRANQSAFRQTAARIDSTRPPLQVLGAMTRDHPTADGLLEEVRSGLAETRRFLVEHEIVTVPSPVLPLVAPTPPYKRSTSWASLDAPGPFEPTAREAYYFVTVPEPTWPAEKAREHLESFSRPALGNLTVHEAYPGHYVQFLWMQQAPSKARKLLTCESNVEGWAHYVEQMMIEGGFGAGKPELRLAQLHDALLRDARFIVGIELHTGKMEIDQAIDFFVREGYQTRTAAELEVRRGAAGPMFLDYTLGKLAILKLRADYKELRGDRFSLREFHDAFLKQGAPPVKLVRRALMGKDGPVLE